MRPANPGERVHRLTAIVERLGPTDAAHEFAGSLSRMLAGAGDGVGSTLYRVVSVEVDRPHRTLDDIDP